jgi:hypothetical protein
MIVPAVLDECGKPAISAGFLAWIAWRFAVPLWTGWPLTGDLLAETALVAGFLRRRRLP